MDMKRFFLYSIVIAALALAGCGGNGGSGTPPVPPVPPVPPPMPCDAGYSMVDGACVKDTPPQASMNPMAVLVGGILAPSDVKRPAETPTGTYNNKRPGKGDNEGISIVNRAGESTTIGGFDNPSSIQVGVEDEDNAGDKLNFVEMTTATPPKPRANQFTMVEGSETTVGKFTGRVHEVVRDATSSAPKTTDRLSVFDNEGSAASETYDTYYGAVARPGVGASGRNADTGILTLAADPKVTKPELYSASWFPTEPGVSKEIAADVTKVEDRKFDGMFNGINGSYSCDAGAVCMVTTDKDKKIAVVSGNWKFTPASGFDGATYKIPGVDSDADYLAFGYWLRTTEEEGEDPKYSIGTFATGAQPYSLVMAQRQALTGSATYKGSAAGMYGKKTLAPNGDITNLATGEFTAAAELTAYFGQPLSPNNTIPPSSLYSVNGTVTDFRGSDGNLIDTWSVDLRKAGFGASGTDNVQTAPDGVTDANSFFGATTGGGDWQGRFFGPEEDANAAVMPSGVAGEFTSHLPNGHVIGAFGATKQ